MVKTEIGCHIAERSWFHALCTYLVLFITAKTADSGARIFVMAALKPKENHVSGGLPTLWWRMFCPKYWIMIVLIMCQLRASISITS